MYVGKMRIKSVKVRYSLCLLKTPVGSNRRRDADAPVSAICASAISSLSSGSIYPVYVCPGGPNQSLALPRPINSKIVLVVRLLRPRSTTSRIHPLFVIFNSSPGLSRFRDPERRSFSRTTTAVRDRRRPHLRPGRYSTEVNNRHTSICPTTRIYTCTISPSTTDTICTIPLNFPATTRPNIGPLNFNFFEYQRLPRYIE